MRFVASQMDAHETARYKGKIEGKIEGKREGRGEERIEIAKNLLDILDDTMIAKKTGLFKAEVANLRK